MTNEEALEIYELGKKDAQDISELDYWLANIDIATKMAFDALKKQIVEKPIHKQLQEVNEGAIFNVFTCPTCGRSLRRYQDAHHCRCGQAVSWATVWSVK